MSLRYGLRDGDIQKLQAVLARYPQISEAIIYGSRAKGNYKPGSDIDLTLKAKMDSWTFNRLLVELDDLLLPYQMDVSLYNDIQNPELKSHIDRVGLVSTLIKGSSVTVSQSTSVATCSSTTES